MILIIINLEDSDTVSLILVVFLFIFCNLTALVVNFLELTLYDKVNFFKLNLNNSFLL